MISFIFTILILILVLKLLGKLAWLSFKLYLYLVLFSACWYLTSQLLQSIL